MTQAKSAAAIISATEVTTGVAARVLKVSQDTVARLCEEGLLRARRVRETGWWMINYDSIMEHKLKIRTLR